jgi:hypothetical protein
MTLRDQICQATDALRLARRSGASYDDLKAAAITLLELRQQAEKACLGRVKTQITAVAIASLIR